MKCYHDFIVSDCFLSLKNLQTRQSKPGTDNQRNLLVSSSIIVPSPVRLEREQSTFSFGSLEVIPRSVTSECDEDICNLPSIETVLELKFSFANNG